MSTVLQTMSKALRIGCGVHLLHSQLYELSETHGESMLPTLNYAGDYVHVNKYYRRGRGVGVGDLIIAVKPTDPHQYVCKRITGMEGDYVLVDPSAGDFERYIQVPKGHCWVTGDNLSASLDSRTYGVMPLGLIKGKIFAIWGWSDGRFEWVSNHFPTNKS
ncbi:hypothetical protein TRICI_003861 [Trichomonascus ciferrii]|uniref:Peptidase S26 domain-containing protein n=1 Tax=Trichomonascus ciferrii TaxID=44093 RepID=A0A642V2L2_9ASCO|nr:hypothetical protein TRICI_003861 [Trichomonascus ciferrii]